MGETAASNPALQVSVSFGRFENDSLSWEKWSAFSPNKYLEEVEKCATPGSVAQKKAYFEAHYKNVAARKAELLAQEKQTEKASVKTQYQNDEDLSCNSCVTDAECDISNAQGSSEGVKQEINSVGEIVRTDVSNLEYAAVSRDYQGSSVEGEKVNDKLERRSSGGSLIEKKQEEVVCVEQGGSKEESPNIEAEGLKEVSHNVNNEPVKASEIEAQYKTLDNPKASKKFGQVTPVSRESNATKGKKKSVQPTSKPKASRISTPRNPKPSSTPTKTFASASSTKKEISPSISGRETASTAENRKVPNKTLHMSLSLGPSQSEPAPRTTVRKSLIMERMGDKDIVKRAFKTFQNNFNQPKTSGENKSLVKEKVPSKVTEPRNLTSISLRKEYGQSPKVDSAGKRSGNTARTAFGLKTDVKAEKGKEFPRKIEEKFYTKEVERTHHQSKSKEEKIKHNIKVTSLPAFHQGQKASKNHSQKEEIKMEKWR
ncbi:protein WVD2-like 7 isoform X1 [Vigna umbellata]|uniref:protein WVD2-like 7 isoform X1 n=1 Tax=Vigna umbellata TaxID=87088 RepID=UPI001F5FDC77|nr:protein WVD2-like 7 isoform X1 [Vigna umbellata]XP_047168365.1 protein WVD2-like 7 isoform X1 [Vigna umbellata]XP_047168366.1 protein WVD2-like 7 isoform X1 [Vigna umbellata]XP_047168367.1 protein WVD2-like 7 isoform X1 [Vigna umbellata]